MGLSRVFAAREAHRKWIASLVAAPRPPDGQPSNESVLTSVRSVIAARTASMVA
ncbi:hypothetical protein C7412_112193 [Paraburkholderia silvatlantica]|nr:hypothetical protein C7412_112193 [Paraburkholderia silvatlantica]